MATYLEQSLAALKRFEGVVPWMYRDTVGKVTVGVGLMLPNAAAACALPFVMQGRAATTAEIASDYARVDALAAGHLPAFYRHANGLELPGAEIDSLLRKTLVGFETELAEHLPEYPTLPDAVKLVLLDMAYNLGVGGLLREYPRLLAAIRSGNWALAAEHCVRHGIGDARNAWAKAALLGAGVVKTVQAVADESRLARLLYGLVGWLGSRFGR